MGFMRNNDRIEGIWQILGRGMGTDPEKIQDMEETRELYDLMVEVEELRKGKRGTARPPAKPAAKKQKPAARLTFPATDTFERGE